MIEHTDFLKKYRIEEKEFKKSGLDWETLNSIYEEYARRGETYTSTANYVADRLGNIPAVHSLKIRIKDAEHLVEKIIRKTIADKAEIDFENYTTQITDLIGIRALHLFKEDWSVIHDYIVGSWKLHEEPTANVRKGDPEEFLAKFRDKGCKINEHQLGYRSVHYLVESSPAKELHVVEIQVRTIFEEGWSEIDHRVRYPYDIDNSILGQFLVIFNRLAGSADEMGSFVRFLKAELERLEEDASVQIQERDDKINDLMQQYKDLKISQKERRQLEEGLSSLHIPTIKFSSSSVVNIPPTMDTRYFLGSTGDYTLDSDTGSSGSGYFTGRTWITPPDIRGDYDFTPKRPDLEDEEEEDTEMSLTNRIVQWVREKFGRE